MQEELSRATPITNSTGHNDMRLILENWRKFINEEELADKLCAALGEDNQKAFLSLSPEQQFEIAKQWQTDGMPGGLLLEAIHPSIQKQIDNLLAMPGAAVAIVDGGKSVDIQYSGLGGEWSGTHPKGRVTIEKAIPSVDGSCFNGWIVAITEADKGWGPLLYEVAIEYASQNGGGLAPDRSTVSAPAEAVWDIYVGRESEVDIQVKQMDIAHGKEKSAMKRYGPEEDVPSYPPGTTMKARTISADDIPQLTPDDEKDDCLQHKATLAGGPDKWMDTVFSKIYFKKTSEVMKALEKAERLVMA